MLLLVEEINLDEDDLLRDRKTAQKLMKQIWLNGTVRTVTEHIRNARDTPRVESSAFLNQTRGAVEVKIIDGERHTWKRMSSVFQWQPSEENMSGETTYHRWLD